MEQVKKLANLKLRKHRVRSKVKGTTTRPRLSVYVSNRHIIAQIINDETGKTLAYSSSSSKKAPKGNLTEKAEWVGSDIATKAKKAKISKVVFDRNGKKYHGRLAKLAETARKAGLEF